MARQFVRPRALPPRWAFPFLVAIFAGVAGLVGVGAAWATTAPAFVAAGATTEAAAPTARHSTYDAASSAYDAPMPLSSPDTATARYLRYAPSEPVFIPWGKSVSVRGGGVAAKAVPNEGIFVIRNAADKVYVGQSGNITSRLGQHVSTGKFTQAEVDAAERFEVLGGKTAREIQEQLKLDSFGGRDASGVLNKVNPIGDRRLSLMPPGYVRP